MFSLCLVGLTLAGFQEESEETDCLTFLSSDLLVHEVCESLLMQTVWVGEGRAEET